jgi:hypothetical protein
VSELEDFEGLVTKHSKHPIGQVILGLLVVLFGLYLVFKEKK